MKPWSHLPNAHLIDWVIRSLGTHTQEWADALDAALNETWEAAYDEAWNSALAAARGETWEAAWEATWNSDYDEAWDVAWDAIIALIVYDDCDQYLNMSYEQLLTYAILSERPQAVLLLSLKWIQEHLPESLAITDNT